MSEDTKCLSNNLRTHLPPRPPTMPRNCSVASCDTNRYHYEPQIKFYLLPPEHTNARAHWLQLMGRDANWKVPKTAAVCSKHFLPEDITWSRKLVENAVPSQKLTAEKPPEKERPAAAATEEGEPSAAPAEVEEIRLRFRPPRKRKPKPKKKRPEVVTVEMQSTNCRMCSAEISLEEGHKLEELKDQGRVCDNIWEIYLVDFGDTSFETHYPMLCDGCWHQMKAFEDFAAKCSQEQTRLFRIFEATVGTSQAQEDEQEIKEEATDEEMEFEEVLLDSDSKPVDADSSNDGDKEDDFPNLEGLTIEQMLEELDKIPKGKRMREVNVDHECWDCGQVFPRRLLAQAHRKVCTVIGTPESLQNRSFVCEVCGKDIRTRAGYRTHLMAMHSEEILAGQKECPEEIKGILTKQRFHCPVCRKGFPLVCRLKYHLKSHLVRQSEGLPIIDKQKPSSGEQKPGPGPAMCQECGKICKNKALLKIHMRFHSKIKNFACDQCEKRYYVQYDLKAHIESVHSKNRVLCGICGKSFTNRQILAKHKRIVHVGPTGKYKCSFCGKAVLDSTNLRYHLMKHTGERNFKCDLCDRDYIHRYQLTQHQMVTHGIHVEGAKLYKQNQKRRIATASNAEEDVKPDGQFDDVEYLQ